MEGKALNRKKQNEEVGSILRILKKIASPKQFHIFLCQECVNKQSQTYCSHECSSAKISLARVLKELQRASALV